MGSGQMHPGLLIATVRGDSLRAAPDLLFQIASGQLAVGMARGCRRGRPSTYRAQSYWETRRPDLIQKATGGYARRGFATHFVVIGILISLKLVGKATI